jgi:hypothetical protein
VKEVRKKGKREKVKLKGGRKGKEEEKRGRGRKE